jgi:hypothetical protein
VGLASGRGVGGDLRRHRGPDSARVRTPETLIAGDIDLTTKHVAAWLGFAGLFGASFAGAVAAQASPDDGGFLGGLGWPLSQDLQLDLYAGLDVASPATFIGGTGFSVRW